MSYATLAELKSWLEFPTDDDGLMDTHLQAVLDATDRWIDEQCGRHFSIENEAIKLYYPTDQGYLDVVDLISITTLKSDAHGDRTYATTFAPTDYELLPYMDAAGRPSVRYQQVRIWPTSSHAFAPGELVQITGDFGYVVGSQPPAEIHLAALMLSSRWYKRHETPSGSAIIPDTGTFDRIVAEDPDIKLLLDTYNRSSASSWVLV